MTHAAKRNKQMTNNVDNSHLIKFSDMLALLYKNPDGIA